MLCWPIYLRHLLLRHIGCIEGLGTQMTIDLDFIEADSLFLEYEGEMFPLVQIELEMQVYIELFLETN